MKDWSFSEKFYYAIWILVCIVIPCLVYYANLDDTPLLPALLVSFFITVVTVIVMLNVVLFVKVKFYAFAAAWPFFPIWGLVALLMWLYAKKPKLDAWLDSLDS